MKIVVLDDAFTEAFNLENPELTNLDMSGWCECEMESEPIYHPDAISTMDNCVEKHHYHCGWCLGLTQIG